jgi:hypothetical protein
MKRFTTAGAVFGVTILAVWAAFQLFTTSQDQPENRIAPVALQTAQARNMKAADSGKEAIVPVTGVEARTVAPAPVYDASGRIVSLSPNGSGNGVIILAPVSRKVAPVYDASGTLLSDPTGTIQSTNNAKVAPVFGANGEVISDPTGTLSDASHP